MITKRRPMIDTLLAEYELLSECREAAQRTVDYETMLRHDTDWARRHVVRLDAEMDAIDKRIDAARKGER